MQDMLTYNNQRFHSLWLRDNCPCPECRHANGQRLHETWQLPADIQIAESRETETGLWVRFAEPHAHESEFTKAYLTKHAYDQLAISPETATLWGSELDLESISFSYDEVISDDRTKLAWLDALISHGITKLSGVPAQAGMILKTVDLFGFVRQTNYGTLFEVKTEEKPQNLAYTPMPLSLHTDNPYRDPVPTLQLLHCLVQAEEGGVTALTDGFEAARILREEHPEKFALLTNQLVRFRFASEDAVLEHKDTMITTNSKGEIVKVRINNRSSAPFQIDFEIMTAFYDAYQTFMRIVQGDRCKRTHKLQSGDLILFNNERVLHGREVQAIGARHLQGCYADIDSLRSTAEVLRSQLNL
ncbi:TauD/TfdA family dioxygenase [Aliamphritea ceti]|uniref:TauD/TfdA family dioxygenase n=1 Tax=Aliamphritea ceti TaxID=1524258 RepID=UPI0021C27E9B|nr:TauD/TfdA family dioxygenase [Aliamphritea ceti]